MTDVSDFRTEIISRLLEHCEESADQPLGLLNCDADVRNHPRDSRSTADSLVDEFGEDAVIVAGVIIKEQERFDLVPPLCDQTGKLIVLRDVESKAPFDLLTNEGCLIKEKLPVFEALKDAQTQKQLDANENTLFVTFSLDDAITLRACGLAATTANGLDELPLDQVDAFCESFGLTRHVSDRANERIASAQENAHQSEFHPSDPRLRTSQLHRKPNDSTSTRFVLVGWSPATLCGDAPAQLSKVVDYVRKLEKHLGVNVFELRLWQPDSEDLERWKFMVDGKCPEMFAADLGDVGVDVDDCIDDFGRPKRSVTAPPSDYATSLARLEQFGGDETYPMVFGADQRKRAWSDCQRLLSQQVIQPLRELALATNCPVTRSMLMLIAELSRTYHTQSLVVADKLRRQITDRGISQADPISSDEMKSLLAVSDRLIEIFKVTNQCAQTKSTIVETSHPRIPTTPRLPHSA